MASHCILYGKRRKILHTELKNIVIRRNQIAHEGDYSEVLKNRQAISKQDTDQVVDSIRDIGNAIYDLVK